MNQRLIKLSFYDFFVIMYSGGCPFKDVEIFGGKGSQTLGCNLKCVEPYKCLDSLKSSFTIPRTKKCVKELFLGLQK